MQVLASNLSPLGQGSGASLDSDAQAFLTAASISDSTSSTATDTLVKALKDAGVWTKLRAIYPFVGGTASTHKWNLKDPRDLDAAFRLTFGGGWTHSSTGAKPNGTTAYADTKFNTSTSGFTSTNGMLALYSRSDTVTSNPYDIGNSDGADTKATILITRYNNNLAFFCFGTSGYSPNGGSQDGRGFFASNRVNGNSEGYKAGVRIINQADTCTLASLSLYIGASNKDGTASYFSDKEYAFAAIGDTLTTQNHADLYAAVQAFQTSLGRQV